MNQNIAEDLRPLARPIGSVKPDPNNARKHPKRSIDALCRALERFGQRKPIVVSADGTIIAGNHTHAAAVSLGWSEIAVVRVDDDAVTAKAFALADNRTGDLGGYDDEALLAALYEVRDDAGLLDAAGYSVADIDALLGPQPLDDWGEAFGNVPDGDKPEHVTMSFSLHYTQAERIRAALDDARLRADVSLNPNKNGAALALIVDEWSAA